MSSGLYYEDDRQVCTGVSCPRGMDPVPPCRGTYALPSAAVRNYILTRVSRKTSSLYSAGKLGGADCSAPPFGYLQDCVRTVSAEAIASRAAANALNAIVAALPLGYGPGGSRLQA